MVERRVVPVRISQAGIERLDALAVKHKITRSDVVRLALRFTFEGAGFEGYIGRQLRPASPKETP